SPWPVDLGLASTHIIVYTDPTGPRAATVCRLFMEDVHGGLTPKTASNTLLDERGMYHAEEISPVCRPHDALVREHHCRRNQLEGCLARCALQPGASESGRL